MWTSSEISPATNNIITARPAMRVPTVNLVPAFCHQVIACTTGWVGSSPCTRSIHCTAATTDSTNDAPTAAIPISEPRLGRRFPKNRIRKKETAGIAGMIQAWFSTARSALQLVDVVEIRRVRVAVDEQHDRQPHPDLGRGDGDDEEREHLPGGVPIEGREC